VGSDNTFPARTDPAEQRSCYLRYFYWNWHPTLLGRIWSRAYAWIAGLGIAPDLLVSLEVRDRVTGSLVSTVLVVARYKEDRYLVSMLGNESDWVLNLRAADGSAFIRSGNRSAVRLREVMPGERAPILKAWSQIATSGRQHLPVPPDAPVDAFAAIASDYPVFRIDPADTDQIAELVENRSTLQSVSQTNRAVQLAAFGGPEQLAVVELPMPQPGRGEVRVRVLASSLNYTDVLIRRHLYPQTSARRPPFTMGYDVVGEIDRLGEGVRGFDLGDRVADMTVIGSNASYRVLRAKDLTLVPNDVDPAEASTLILSWMTAYQLLHRAAKVRPGQCVLVHGAAGAVGQALLQLGKLAGVQLWGGARGKNAPLIRELGATPVDYEHEDFTRVLPGGFDVVIDGIGEDGYRRSFKALKPRGQLIAIGYSASVQARKGLASILSRIARLYLWRFLPGGKRARFYSINAMRARHPNWFCQDLGHLLGLLRDRLIQPRVAERVSFDCVVDAHRRLEEGGLVGKVVLIPSD